MTFDQWSGESTFQNMSGLEVLGAMVDGDIPPPPMAAVIPFRIHAFSAGEVEIRAAMEERFGNLFGMAFGGWPMSLLDYAMGFAAVSMLPAGEICPSVECAVKFVRPIRVTSGEIRATGRVQSCGRSVIHVQGRLEDGAGKLYSLGTSTCLRTAI